MKGLRSTIFLAVVLIGLGAYVYYDASKPEEPASKQEKLFTGFNLDKVEELTVKATNGDTTALKKGSDGGWQITAPVTDRAAETEVVGLSGSVGQLEVVRVIDEKPTDLKQYGLDPPRIEIAFVADSGKSKGKISIGEKSPTGNGLYARRNDEPRVFLISAFQETILNRGTFDLRDKLIVHLQRDKVDGVEVTADGKSVAFKKAGTDWLMTAPLAARADSSTVEGLVGRIETAQMKTIVTSDATAADLKKYGLDKPSLAVTVSLGSAKATLAIGGKGEDGVHYARDASRSVVIGVDSAFVNDLKAGADDYRRHDVFDFRSFNATRLELLRNDQTLVFERTKGTGDNGVDTWRRTAPTAADVDNAKFESLLTALSDLKISGFTDAKAKTGLEKPILKVSAKFDEGKKEESASFGVVGSDTFVSHSDDPGVGKIDQAAYERALKALDELPK